MLPRNSGIAHPFLFYSTFCFCKSVIFIIKFLPQESVHYKATCNHSFFTFQLACCKSVAVEFSLKHKVPESPLFPEVSGHLNASWYYSHSIVPGGLSVMSRTTRLTWGVSAIILLLILRRRG